MFWKIQTQIYSLIFLLLAAILFLIIFNIKLKKQDPTKKPTYFILVMEFFITSINTFVEKNLGKKWVDKFGSYLGALSYLIFFGTTIGILGMTAITTSLTVTVTFGLITFIIYNVTAFKFQKLKFFKRFVEPIFIFLPINIIAVWSPLISMSVRLFANVLAGTIIISLAYGALNAITAFLVPINIFGILIGPILHAYFDLFAGLIQTIVFLSLTVIYTQQEMNTS